MENSFNMPYGASYMEQMQQMENERRLREKREEEELKNAEREQKMTRAYGSVILTVTTESVPMAIAATDRVMEFADKDAAVEYISEMKKAMEEFDGEIPKFSTELSEHGDGIRISTLNAAKELISSETFALSRPNGETIPLLWDMVNGMDKDLDTEHEELEMD